METILLLSLAVLAPPPPPAAAEVVSAPSPVPRKARARKRRRPRYKAGRPAASMGTAAAPRFRVALPPRRWRLENRRELERLMEELGRPPTGYWELSETLPPAALFILDDVAVHGSVGELAFRRLVDRAEFKIDDAFWGFLPPPYGDRARTGYQGFKDAPRTLWPTDPYFQIWRKALFAARLEVCESRGRRACVAWMTRLLAGFEEFEVALYMKRVIDEELQAPVGVEDVRESAGDEKPVRARTGLRRVPEVQDLVRALLDHGFDVWVMSDSNQWAAAALAARYGVDPTRAIGVRCEVVNKVLQPHVVDPIPHGTGRAEALVMFLGRGPELVVGAGKDDQELLEYGDGLRLVFDRGDPAFTSYARGRGWLVQPAFPPGPPEAPPSQ